jgi:pimeloyl-ACP methyl ester carboxylesterase
LVLLHAFPLHAGMYDRLLPLLPDGAVTPDFPGFGSAAEPAGAPSLATYAKAVLAGLDAAGYSRVILGGTSMGGYVAMEVLRLAPERVLGLALLDTKASADAPAAQANRERIAASAETDGLAVVHADVEPALLGDTSRAERADVVAEVHGMVAAADPAAVAWAQRAMAARPDSLADLSGCDRPALVLRGDEDVLATEADAQAMADALGDAESVTVGGAGHLAAVETPAEVAAALTRLIARCAED